MREVNSPSLFTGCKGSRQSVSALVPGQSYVSLYINAETGRTAMRMGAGERRERRYCSLYTKELMV